MSENVLPMFSSKSFMVSCFTFTSLGHFDFIFVYSVKEYSKYFLMMLQQTNVWITRFGVMTNHCGPGFPQLGKNTKGLKNQNYYSTVCRVVGMSFESQYQKNS